LYRWLGSTRGRPEHMSLRRVRAVVRGDVQGVGFRWFIREHARALDLAGWVRNHADGSVEFTAEGDDARVDRLLALARRGPAGAIVKDLTLAEPGPDEKLDVPFTIRR
jgi:acylphosphatase